jgi:hypothetical protein
VGNVIPRTFNRAAVALLQLNLVGLELVVESAKLGEVGSVLLARGPDAGAHTRALISSI